MLVLVLVELDVELVVELVDVLVDVDELVEVVANVSANPLHVAVVPLVAVWTCRVPSLVKYASSPPFHP